MIFVGATEIVNNNNMPTFKIRGPLYHRIGSLISKPNEQAKFLQIHFIGYEEQQCS